MYSPFVISVAVLVFLYLALRARVYLTQHRDEPPVLLTSIPFLSPIIGLLRRRYRIYLDLLHRHKFPIYTLRVPMAKLYIVNDPSLIPVIERQPKAIAFAPIEAAATANLLGMSEATNETLKRDPTGEDGHFITFHHAVRPPLAPGQGLDLMLQDAANSLAASLDRLRKQRSSTVSLFAWVQREIIMATTDAEFGSGNPFREPEFERAWHTFESQVHILSATRRPSLFTPHGLEAREFLAARFARYFEEGHHLQGGSPYLLARQAHGARRGMTPDDRARGEVGSCLGLFNNTVAAAFWTVFHVFSDPVLLGEVRAELAPGVSTTAQADGSSESVTKTVDLAFVRSRCPVLVSTLQEVCRFRGIGTLIVRRVLRDHMLAGRWLLKKGGIVAMPNSVLHFDPATWGPDVNVFDYRRFVKGPGKKTHHPSAFRVFGSGRTLCPGRYFANTEILALVALLVLQFNIRPKGAKEDGAWVQPRTDNAFGIRVARVFLVPENDVEVEICARGDENEQWRAKFGE